MDSIEASEMRCRLVQNLEKVVIDADKRKNKMTLRQRFVFRFVVKRYLTRLKKEIHDRG